MRLDVFDDAASDSLGPILARLQAVGEVGRANRVQQAEAPAADLETVVTALRAARRMDPGKRCQHNTPAHSTTRRRPLRRTSDISEGTAACDQPVDLGNANRVSAGAVAVVSVVEDSPLGSQPVSSRGVFVTKQDHVPGAGFGQPI